jgi:hypothetical protein
MANKRLSITEVEQMKEMVKKGVAPEDIANHFDVAISSVHNYKKKFKEQGVQFPNLKGKRPQGSIKPTASITPKSATVVSSGGKTADMQFVVNGIAVTVSGQAKTVTINKDSLEVNF